MASNYCTPIGAKSNRLHMSDPEIQIQGPCFSRGGWSWNTSRLDDTIPLETNNSQNRAPQNANIAQNQVEQKTPTLDRVSPNTNRFNPMQTSKMEGRDHSFENYSNVRWTPSYMTNNTVGPRSNRYVFNDDVASETSEFRGNPSDYDPMEAAESARIYLLQAEERLRSSSLETLELRANVIRRELLDETKRELETQMQSFREHIMRQITDVLQNEVTKVVENCAKNATEQTNTAQALNPGINEIPEQTRVQFKSLSRTYSADSIFLNRAIKIKQ